VVELLKNVLVSGGGGGGGVADAALPQEATQLNRCSPKPCPNFNRDVLTLHKLRRQTLNHRFMR
jgi:hypothetical protein